MALGIGANTAVFSVVHAVLLRPLPYDSPDRTVTLNTAFLTSGQTQGLVSIANFRDWREQSSSFDAMATYRGREYPVTPDREAEYARGAVVDADFFRVFGVETILGRTFTAEETLPGSCAVLASHDYWQRRLDADADVLGRTVRRGSDPWPVVGVLPPGFRFPGMTDLWVPERTESTSSSGHSYFAVGRRKPSVTFERTQAERQRSAPVSRNSTRTPTPDVTAVRLRDQLVGDVRPTLYLLRGIAALVLLIACANTATLLLDNAAGRTREAAVRTALGASRPGIIRQLLAESLLLALIAGGGPAACHRRCRLDDARLHPGCLGCHERAVRTGAGAPRLTRGPIRRDEAGRRPERGGRELVADPRCAGGVRDWSGRPAADRRRPAAQEPSGSPGRRAGLSSRERPGHASDRGASRPAGRRVLHRDPLTSERAVRRRGRRRHLHPAGQSAPQRSGSGVHYVDRKPETPDSTREQRTLFNIVAPGTFALGIPVRNGREVDEGDPPIARWWRLSTKRSCGSRSALSIRLVGPSSARSTGMTG